MNQLQSLLAKNQAFVSHMFFESAQSEPREEPLLWKSLRAVLTTPGHVLIGSRRTNRALMTLKWSDPTGVRSRGRCFQKKLSITWRGDASSDAVRGPETKVCSCLSIVPAGCCCCCCWSIIAFHLGRYESRYLIVYVLVANNYLFQSSCRLSSKTHNPIRDS